MSIPHGTITGYNYHKCRCDDCVEARRTYQREYMRKRKLRDPEYREREAEKRRTRMKNNPEQERAAKQRSITRNKRIRQEFLDAGCTDCGSSENLHFHHVDPSTKVKSVAFYAQTPTAVERLMAEIEKCVVVCQPCHMARHDRMRQGLPQEPTSAQEA